jgi:hypothetical protein
MVQTEIAEVLPYLAYLYVEFRYLDFLLSTLAHIFTDTGNSSHLCRNELATTWILDRVLSV